MTAHLEYTPLQAIPGVINDLRATFRSGLTKPLSYRREQLQGLHNLVKENEAALQEAAFLDLHKPPQEFLIGESGMVLQECIDFIKNLENWAAKKQVAKPLISKMDDIHIRRDPVGVVLVIGAWNYPVNLLLVPAAGAIAAGNTVLLKPSEVSSHTAALITQLLPKYLDQRSYRIVNGAAPETTVLLEHKFDHIFYTGAGTVGKIVMSAAAKQLTPVTLELGGKSPAFVDKDADVQVVAKRIVFSKCYNSGQSCIAPDYIILEKGHEEAFAKAFQAAVAEFYGPSPQTSHSFGRIVNKNHFNRLRSMLEKTKGQVVVGGDYQEDDLYIAPTLVLNVKPEDSLMASEIFGPILPVVSVDRLTGEGIDLVNDGDQPLALYVFSSNKKLVDEILDNTRSGGVVVNDALLQFMAKNLPFGGTGPSGIGKYHGEKSFEIFSHERGTIVKSLGMDKANTIKYPPYSEKKIGWLQWLLYDKASYSANKTLGAPSKL